MKVTTDKLAAEISKTLSEYADTTFDTVKKAVDKTTKETVERLKLESPVRTGAYAKNWTSKQEKGKNKWAYSKTVYNKKYYRLTHLLEKGHKKVGGGFVAARPHIERVEREAVENLMKEIKEGI